MSAVSTLARPPEPIAPARDDKPQRASWKALGTSAELLVLGDEAQLARARAAVEAVLDEVDRACSRFRADSELTRLNQSEGRPVRVSPLLIEATELALRGAVLTDGDLDPTIGRALELAGYDRDWRLIEQASAGAASAGEDPARRAAPVRVRARVRPGWRGVRLDRRHNTIELPRGAKLDLGATAKAWAADRAASAACATGASGALVSLGGDIATAGERPKHGWQARVTDDHRSGPEAPGQTVSIGAGGLATSSTTVRRWTVAGESRHHIIDPSTGVPASTRWRTVSVAAGDCADANIAATAAIVRGERAAGWLEAIGLPARLVSSDGEVLAVAGWPSEQERR